MQPVIDSLPAEWEKIVWDNGERCMRLYRFSENRGILNNVTDEILLRGEKISDLSVYGRYAAIEYASHSLIYVQDDDVIVSDPQAIVDEVIDEGTHMDEVFSEGLTTYFDPPNIVACNMPQEFRPNYPDSALVGFGACFHRDAPRRAFDRYGFNVLMPGVRDIGSWLEGESGEKFNRTCDVVFTALTPRILVDVPRTNREFASNSDRMWKQPGHVEERARMLELALKVRDAS